MRSQRGSRISVSLTKSICKGCGASWLLALVAALGVVRLGVTFFGVQNGRSKWQRPIATVPSAAQISLLLGRDSFAANSPEALNWFVDRPISAWAEQKLTSFETAANLRCGEEVINEGTWSPAGFGPFPINRDIDWSADPFSNRTWQWRLHHWGFVPCLVAYDRMHRGHHGAELAMALVEDWSRDNLGADAPSEMTWHDHATALRAQYLMAIFAHVSQLGLMDELFLTTSLRLAVIHASVLSLEKFYSEKTNHGFDQSMALYELAASFPEIPHSEVYRKQALSRLAAEIHHAFAADGGHVENSPEYHIYGINQLTSASKLLHAYGDQMWMESLRFSLEDTLNKAVRALAYMIRPDGTLPLIGDTTFRRVRDFLEESMRPTSHEVLLYALTQGRQGTAPKDPDLVLPQTGYAFLRNAWSPPDAYADDVHVAFKCGFLSRYHRQDDDLSFVLYALGEEWLSDGGLYEHRNSDLYRRYFQSAVAHNISAPIEAKTHRKPHAVPEKGGIIAYDLRLDSSEVVGKTLMFVGFESQRRLIYERPFKLRVEDRIRPSDDQAAASISTRVEEGEPTYVTRFHVPADKTITRLPGNVGITAASQRGSSLAIRVNGRVPSEVRLIKGQKEPRPLGWISRRRGELEPVNAVEFYFTGKSLSVAFDLVLMPGRHRHHDSDKPSNVLTTRAHE